MKSYKKEGISVRKIIEILRLHFECKLSNRQISQSCNISPTTVGSILKKAADHNLDYRSAMQMDELTLKKEFFPGTSVHKSGKPSIDFEYIKTELGKKHVTLQILFEEYKIAIPGGFERSQFFNLCRQHFKKQKITMRVNRVPGERTEVDYSGDKMNIVNPKTGEISPAEIFVSAVGVSQYIFAYASDDQKLENWIDAHVRMFNFYGACSKILVPDNLKSGVTHACYYDPEINRTYNELADHYAIAVIPARPKSPRDKPKAENAVLNAQRRIMAPLRNRTFFSLSELNAAISEELEKLNNREKQIEGKSRLELFQEIDLPAMNPLPSKPYIFFEWKTGNVNPVDQHVEIDHNYYSVPYKLLLHKIDVKYNKNTVEIICNGERIASHIREKGRGRFVTDPSHRLPKHAKSQTWSPERIKEWAATVGNKTEQLMGRIMESRKFPEQGFRACVGILKLSKIYSHERMEKASIYAMDIKALRYPSVKSILEKNLDSYPLYPEKTTEQNAIIHENIRGDIYYQQEDDNAQRSLFGETESSETLGNGPDISGTTGQSQV